MRQHPGEEILESLYFRQLAKSEQLEQLVALFFQDTVQKAKPWRYSKFKRMVTRYLEQKR